MGVRLATVTPFITDIASQLEATMPMPCFKNHVLSWQTKTIKFRRRKGRKLVISSGAVPRVMDWLRQSGYSVEMTDARGWRPTPSDESPAANPDAAGIARDVLRTYFSALFSVENPAHLRRLFCAVVQAVLSQKVIVIVASRAECATWSDTLRASLDEKVSILTPRQTESSARIVIATCETACLTRHEIAPFVFVPSGELALTARFQEFLTPIGPRVFGFVPSSVEFDPAERLLIEFIFENEVYVDHARDNPEVHLVAIDSGSNPATSSPLAWKQLAVWNNAERNRAIAEIVRLILADGLARQQWPPFRANEAVRRPVLLVECLSHAHALARVLPEWATVNAETTSHWKLFAEHSEPAFARRAGIILTYDALDQALCRVGDVLIRADAGSGALSLTRGVVPSVVIDLVDRRGAGFADRLRQRRAAYQTAGWTIQDGMMRALSSGDCLVAR